MPKQRVLSGRRVSRKGRKEAKNAKFYMGPTFVV
jgi:hypothetical protein